MPERPSDFLTQLTTKMTPAMYEEAFGYQIAMQSQRNFEKGLGYEIQKKDGQLVLDSDLLEAAIRAIKLKESLKQTAPRSTLYDQQKMM